MYHEHQHYWEKLHEQHKGELRAVGHPFLSDDFNQLKYESESESFLVCLSEVIDGLKRMNKTEISVMDIGAGYGYWSGLAHGVLVKHGLKVDIGALDISPVALNVIRERLPQVQITQVDLKTISTIKYQGLYDLVFSCYCLHHLVRFRDFLNAINFAAESVRKNGYLLIMDPILRLPFSHADTLDFLTFRGNGIPRHLYLIDDILSSHGLQRRSIKPAVSFLLNENIEAPDWSSYFFMLLAWKILCRLDHLDHFVKHSSGVLRRIDLCLKQLGLAFSSSICVYQKNENHDASVTGPWN